MPPEEAGKTPQDGLAGLTDAQAMARRLRELNAKSSPIDYIDRGAEMDRMFKGARGFARAVRRMFLKSESEQTKVQMIRLAAETINKAADHQKPALGIDDLSIEQLTSILEYIRTHPDDPRLHKPPRENPDSFGA